MRSLISWAFRSAASISHASSFTCFAQWLRYSSFVFASMLFLLVLDEFFEFLDLRLRFLQRERLTGFRHFQLAEQGVVYVFAVRAHFGISS